MHTCVRVMLDTSVSIRGEHLGSLLGLREPCRPHEAGPVAVAAAASAPTAAVQSTEPTRANRETPKLGVSRAGMVVKELT